MRRDERSPLALVPALIVGGSILAGCWALTVPLNQAVLKLGELQASLAATKGALEQVAKAQPAAATPARRGPDPNKRYTLARNGAPAKGPDTAKVKIFEFSDFQ